jgi:GxxExxY protein
VDCARAVLDELGCEHTEAVYEAAFLVEVGWLRLGVPILSQVTVPIKYKNYIVGYGRLDVLVGDQVVVELKAVRTGLTDRDVVQLRKYLEGTGITSGLLLNFGAVDLEVRHIEKRDNA